MVFPDKSLSRLRRLAVRHECRGESGLALELRYLLRPLPGDGRRNEEAFAPIMDRAFEELLERQLAESFMQLHPSRDRAGHGGGVPAARRHRLLSAKIVERPARGRAARGVE